MASPWSIAATGWMVTVLGWLLSPIISLIISKLVARLIFDTSEELHKLKWNTVRDLKKTQGVVEELRMMEAARDERSRSGDDLATLNMLDTRLKSALYEAEDILDLVEYQRIEKELTGGDDGRWVQRLIQAAGASIVGLGRASWASVRRLLHASGACIAFYCIDITPAPLVQLVHSMEQKLGRVFGGWSSGEDVLPVSQATSTVGVRQKICGLWRHLVAKISSCLSAVLRWSIDRIADARYYRDWSYEQVGIKCDLQKDGIVHITERIRLKKQIKGIEYILNSLMKSDLLNQNNSISSIDENNAKESSSKQKEIVDDMYRSIGQVIGRDKHRDDIMRMLRDGPDTNAASSSTSKPSVIGIYGITGYGKSTLAQYVCDYEKEAGHFNPIMFIHVGNTFKLGDIFRNMLVQIKQKEPSEDKDLKLLKTELEEELKGKCFLLVLDDVWVNGDKWKEREILLVVLDAGKSASRILVTAQKKDAAAALGAQEKMQIQIPDLEEEQYLSMFMHYALEVNQVTSTDYERYNEIARKITKKLHRSPIAARTVAARLQSNNSIDFWETTANLDVLNETMGALWWSYQQLGVDIRRCFAFCSIFPKAYILDQDKLVRMWIAQGFVNTRTNAIEELEALGRSYFNELLTFLFIQVRITERFGEDIVEYTIHDLLHELVQRVYGSEFCRIDLKNYSTKCIPPGVRHLFIETNNFAEIVEKIVDLGNLRTLIIDEQVSPMIKERNCDLKEVLERLFMTLPKLRVLILRQFRRVSSVPASIDKMKHLRYIALNCYNSRERLILPSTFSKLYHIQIINIPCYEASGPLSFPNIGRLTSLQTLKGFSVKEEPGCELKQMKHLNKLRGTLSILGLGFVGSKKEALDARLKHKQGLRKLKLQFDGRHGPNALLRRQRVVSDMEADMEAEVLEGLCPPKDLQELCIQFYSGSRYPSWMLSRHTADTLKQLHRLELSYCSQLASIPEGSELFIGLHELRIDGCDWDRLPENIERLVRLQTLELSCCDKMELLLSLPQALERIHISWCHMLRSIGIADCPRLEFIWEKKERLEACTSLEYCELGTPEKSPYPMIRCPCITLQISNCANLVTLPNLPPSLKVLSIGYCGELCSVSGQLGQLETLCIRMCNKLQSVTSLGDAAALETESLMIRCPCLVSLNINDCANLVTLPNLPPSLKVLSIGYCGELCSVSGQLGQLNTLDIDKCNKLQSVDSLGDASSLEKLCLSYYQCLESLGPRGGPVNYMSLRQLHIEYCPAMDMKQFNKNVLDGLVEKDISEAHSSNPYESD